MTRRAESMPPVGLNRTKSELLAGMPLFGAGADIELAGGKKLEGLPEFPRGDQLSARETRQRLCGISIDHQIRRRSPPPESLIPTRGWETLSPRQQNEHTLRAEKYALLLGRDTLRRERPEDVAPRMLKDTMSSDSTASSITRRSPRLGWNKYFHLGQSPLSPRKEAPHPANDVARWYRANKHALCADLYTAPSPHKSNQILPPKIVNAWESADLLTVNHPMESMICPRVVAPPTDSMGSSPMKVAPPTDSMDSSPMKGDMDGGETTPVETTAGPSTAGSSPPLSSPPVPYSPRVPDEELIVTGNITIPLRLQTIHPSQSPKNRPTPIMLSPTKHQVPQKAKVISSRAQPKDKHRGVHGQRSGAMSTPVPPPAPFFNAASGYTSNTRVQPISRADTRAALTRMKAVKAQMNTTNYNLDSVQKELEAVERMLNP